MELLIEYFLEIHILVYETFETLCEILAVHFCVSYDLQFSLQIFLEFILIYNDSNNSDLRFMQRVTDDTVKTVFINANTIQREETYLDVRMKAMFGKYINTRT